jgi:Lrp/AsnC family leucine-responsive transcriptional regulator
VAHDSSALDRIDREILAALRDDGRMSWREVGERVHLAPTSVADRVRRLERLGAITGYSVRVEPAALGRDVRAVIDVGLPPGLDPARFEARLATRPEVSFAAYVTGTFDYAIVAECEGAAGLDALIRWLKVDAGAARTESRLVLRLVTP